MFETALWSLAQYFLSVCHGLNTAVGAQDMARGEAVGIRAMFQQERQTQVDRHISTGQTSLCSMDFSKT